MPDQAWSLVTVLDGHAEQAAALRADGVAVRLPVEARAPGVMAMMPDWDATAATLRGWTPDGDDVLEDAKILAPLRYPNKLICVAANYSDHMLEMGLDDPPAVAPAPFCFMVPPTTTVIGDGEPIRISGDPSWRVDWEAELAIVIGAGGRRISETDALAHVAGYTALNDVSARGLNIREDPLGPPFAFDWLAAKGVDTFCPMGAGMTPAWLVDDPEQLTIRCWINGELKQDGTTAKMFVGLAGIIASISELITLEPGDVIATGTPAGVGVARGEQLHDGDTVTIEIDGVARLSNPVVVE